MGNCLCVLGDAMAMPVGSMVAKFRQEFEDEIERARGGWAVPEPAPPVILRPPTQGALA
jgi:NADH-quinone oxidoreductase subunit F